MLNEETPKSDRKDLKIRALLEKVSELEDRVADLRVELTMQNEEMSQALFNANSENDELTNENAELKEELSNLKENLRVQKEAPDSSE